MSKTFHSFFAILALPLFLLFFITFFFIPITTLSSKLPIIQNNEITEIFYLNEGTFAWPTPGYTTITSYFGYRKAPTSGASSYHSGIDIGAPVGTNIISIFSGTVTYVGFSGAGGCTITVKSENLSVSYCHVDPDYIVNVGDIVNTGDVIAQVGPKNIYGIINNPYKDSSGRPTNGATTGPHLHLTLKKDGQAVNPLDFF